MKKYTICFFLLYSINSFSQTTSEEYFQKADELHQNGNYEKAIIYATKSIDLDNTNPSAYNLRGVAKYELKQYEDAILDYNHAIDLDSQEEVYYSNRGHANIYLRHDKEAILDFDRAIAIDIDYISAYFFRGNAKGNLGLYEDAISDYDRAILLNPQEGVYYATRGTCKGRLAQFNEAISDYDQAIALDYKTNFVFTDRGWLKAKSGQYEDAISDFDQALALDTNYFFAYYWKGKSYYYMNEMIQASKYFNKVISLNFDSLYTCFSKMYLGLKDIALSEMEEILNANPSASNYYSLSGLYAIAGETDLALKNLDIALSKGYNEFMLLQKNKNYELIIHKTEYKNLLKKYNITNINNNIPLSRVITNEVKLAIMKWQEKGEFETTATYLERMKTRENEVKKITQKVTNQLEEEYIQKIDWSSPEIGRYDSDGQSFLITFKGIKGIILNVPLAEAQTFKSNFSSYIVIGKNLVISNDQWVISELTFTHPPDFKKYQYNIINQPDYNPNKIFSFNYDELNLQIEEYNLLTSQEQTLTTPITVGKDPVDIDIPVTTTNNLYTFALVIGNEKYKNEISVPFALNDAVIFSEYCKKTLGLPANNVHLVKDGTYGQILGEIRWLQEVLKAFDGKAKALLYYAGHGMPDEKDQSAYLLPIDGKSSLPTTAIKLDDLYATLGESSNAGIIIFLDACFSGGSREGTLAQGRGVKVRPKENIVPGNIVVFSAASSKETALPIKEKNHGLFTYYLLKKLQESKGDISLYELTNYVTNEVKQQSIVVNSKSQNPKINVSIELKDKWKSLKMK